ncbi:SPOR domain-containing protein [Chitinimonas sp.]|uniref:SPOR domain-containing protein n=1 Tax=Chitinimonas sp. TaxID=1934313 RepID=UPI0035B30621
MSKDYKQSGKKPSGNGGSRSNARSGGGGSSVFAGLLIGLCLGVAIAVAAALYLNRAPNPFAGKVPVTPPPVAGTNTPPKPPGVVAPLVAPTNLPPGDTGAAANPANPGDAATKPPAGNANPAKSNDPANCPTGDRFCFYDMLAGKDAGKPAPVKPEAAAPVVAPPKGVYLQAGAFQNETDADNMKAKLALMGLEASIQSSEVADKGIIHRVRIGPLAKAEDIDRVRGQLRANGVDSSIVKN